MAERWRPVAGFEDCYQVSSYGRVRSLDRRVRACESWRIARGQVLRPFVSPTGLRSVSLSRNAQYTTHSVDKLVEATFGPPEKENGPEGP